MLNRVYTWTIWGVWGRSIGWGFQTDSFPILLCLRLLHPIPTTFFSFQLYPALSLEEPTGATEAPIDTAVGEMPQPHLRVLISFVGGEPDWLLLQVSALRDLPAIRWRQQNLDRMS